MRKLLALIIIASLVLSPALVVFAGGNGNSPGNQKEKATKIEKVENGKSGLQKPFKFELNEQINNNYSEEELAQLENAAGLIEKKYADAEVLGLGSVIIKKNIIKLDGPAYIKGGRTIIPVRAITEGLGATVVWDPETKSVMISKDGIEINLTMGSSIALVNGVEQQIDVQAEITNSRTYVPLRFIAETFGLITNWDGDSNVIDIEEGTDEIQETSDSAIDISTDVSTQADAVNE